jgi:hypothetical protein
VAEIFETEMEEVKEYWKKIHNKQLRTLYSITHIIRVAKYRTWFIVTYAWNASEMHTEF